MKELASGAMVGFVLVAIALFVDNAGEIVVTETAFATAVTGLFVGFIGGWWCK